MSSSKYLFKKLELVGYVEETNFLVKEIIAGLNNETITYKDFKDERQWAFFHGNIKKETIWFDDGARRNLKFYLEEKELYCNVNVYERDTYGCVTFPRFSVTLILPKEFIKEIEDKIESDFSKFLERQYEIYLDHEKRQWMGKLAKKLLLDKENNKK